MIRKLVIPLGLFTVGIAMIVAIVWTAPRPAAPVPDASEPRQQTFDQMLLVGDSAIYVDDQPAGATEVSVGFAVMPQAGFVVIYDDADGVPGQVVGVSTLLASGGGEHVAVPLVGLLADGEIYYAMLYRDDGDGTFDTSADAQATDPSNNVVMMSFAARADASPEDGPVLP